jgi:hypothetical protein
MQDKQGEVGITRALWHNEASVSVYWFMVRSGESPSLTNLLPMALPTQPTPHLQPDVLPPP